MLTIADRRAIMITSMLQADFRDLLRKNPRDAVERVTGRPAPAEARIEVVEESPDAWEFVVPATAIEGALPIAQDARAVIENDVYALLRDQPQVRETIIGAPKAFLADRLNFDIGNTGINVREEGAGELVLILPYGDSREELNDDALDLVAGGGDPGSQSANWEAQKEGTQHES